MRFMPSVYNHLQGLVISRRVSRPGYVLCLETLARAWSESRKAQVVYRSYSRGETTERLFAPYFIEPAGLGYATHVVGFDDLRQDIRTLKAERIISATLTNEPYRIPADFDPSKTLASAWGIIWSDEETVEVQLRFSPRAAERVRESTWHSSQRIDDQSDGSCLFTVRIGSVLELKPWIRQWGADVEVISPLGLRKEIAAEAHAMSAVYGV